MPRKNTINFLQIEHGLENAIKACRERPEAPYSARHREQLEAVADDLTEATGRADRLYLSWRAGIKGRLIAAKQLMRRFEVIRDELGEYGVEAKPSGRITYWYADQLLVAAGELLEVVGSNADIPEAGEWKADLEALTQGLKRAMREEEQALADYQRIAPLRRQAIYRAMHAVDEFDALRRDYDA